MPRGLATDDPTLIAPADPANAALDLLSRSRERAPSRGLFPPHGNSPVPVNSVVLGGPRQCRDRPESIRGIAERQDGRIAACPCYCQPRRPLPMHHNGGRDSSAALVHRQASGTRWRPDYIRIDLRQPLIRFEG